MDPTNVLDPARLLNMLLAFSMMVGVVLGIFLGYALRSPSKTQKRFIYAAITSHLATGLHSSTEAEVLADLQEKFRVGRLD